MFSAGEVCARPFAAVVTLAVELPVAGARAIHYLHATVVVLE